METSIKEKKKSIIIAGFKAVDELIKIAEEVVVHFSGVDDNGVLNLENQALAADRLKNAAATKKLAIFDAFEILARIERERELLDEPTLGANEKPAAFSGFAEKRSK